jgi:hypothetical protein
MEPCARCALYIETRGPRIKAEIAKTHKGSEALIRFAKFIDDYHALHVTAGRFAALMSIIHAHEEPS